MAKVVVTRKIFENGIQMLKDQGYEVSVGQQDAPMERKQLLEFVKGADAVMTLLHDRVDEEFLVAAGDQLKIVANYAVGFDNLDLEAIQRHNVVATNTPDTSTEAVAEYAIALMLAIARRVVEANEIAHKQNLEFGPKVLLGAELKGKTLGILGLGRIGGRTAQIARCIGMNVVYYDIKRNTEFEGRIGATFRSTIEELFKEADVVSVHVPLLPTTRHLINRQTLSFMKSTAYLVNTSRGGVIDEAALVDVLKSGKIAGAALDVFEDEPKLSPGLESLTNVVLSPHIGSATSEARSAMAEIAAKNIIAVLSNQPPLTPIIE